MGCSSSKAEAKDVVVDSGAGASEPSRAEAQPQAPVTTAAAPSSSASTADAGPAGGSGSAAATSGASTGAAQVEASPAAADASLSPDGIALALPPAPALSKYTDLDALLAFVGGGDVQLVKASHFLALAAQEGGRFLRRQDLPPEACATPADLQRWAAECKATLALRDKWGGADMDEGDRAELMSGARFPPFVVGSYAWCAPRPSPPSACRLAAMPRLAPHAAG